MYFETDLVQFCLIFTKDMRVKNIGEVKFLSYCIEQPTTGQRRKTDPFFSFYHPDTLYPTKPVGIYNNKEQYKK